MTKKKIDSSGRPDDLRRQVEEIIRKKVPKLPENLDSLSPEEQRKLRHELRVHQIELTMQNESLRRTQEELESSRVRYFNLYDLAPVGYLALSEEGLTQEANLTAASLLGVERSVLIKKSLTRFIHREDQDFYYLHHKQLFETGKPQVCELRMVKKDGSLFWVRLESTIARDSESGSTLSYTVISDITERKQAEKALTESEEKFRITLKNSPIVVWNQDKDLRYTWIYNPNPGFKPEETLGKTDKELLPADDAEKLMHIKRKVLESGIGVREETKTTINGDDYYYDLTVEPLLDSNNIIIGITCAAVDITSQKKTEQELVVSEEKYHNLFENTGTATMVLEEDMTISMINSQAEKLIGYSKEESENKMKWTDFIIPQDLERMKKYHIARRKDGEKPPTEYEFRMMDKKGKVKDIFVKGRTIPNTKKSIACLTDITKRKQAEEKLKKQTHDLNERIKELNCFFKLSKIMEKMGQSLEEILQAIISLLPSSWQYPEITCARIILDEKECKTDNFKETIWKQSADIKIQEKTVGRLEIYYLEERKMMDEGPFQKEEGKLISATAERLGNLIEGKQSEIKLQQSYQKLKNALDASIETMSKIIEVKDPYTAGHQQKVSQLTTAIAKELNFSPDKVEGIRIASLIHDIGKISVPTEILSKTTTLSDIEFSLIKGHSQAGSDILKAIDFSYPVAQIVLQHHERLDGTGYPNNLKGDEILLEAKIIGVADVVGAMLSQRPYRSAHSMEEVLEEISKNKGILYDPKIVDVCIKLFKEKGFKFK